MNYSSKLLKKSLDKKNNIFKSDSCLILKEKSHNIIMIIIESQCIIKMFLMREALYGCRTNVIPERKRKQLK